MSYESTLGWYAKNDAHDYANIIKLVTAQKALSEATSKADTPKPKLRIIEKLKTPVYKETYKRSPNQSGTIKPKFIVLHDSYGSYAGTVSWISQSKSQVSYHYSIEPNTGNRTQHVYDSQKAWHAGYSEWKGYTNLNSHSIGIAFMGKGVTVSENEIDSVARKCIELMDKFDMTTYDLEDTVIRHEDIAPRRKIDTTVETYNRVIARIKQLENGNE